MIQVTSVMIITVIIPFTAVKSNSGDKPLTLGFGAARGTKCCFLFPSPPARTRQPLPVCACSPHRAGPPPRCMDLTVVVVAPVVVGVVLALGLLLVLCMRRRTLRRSYGQAAAGGRCVGVALAGSCVDRKQKS